MKLRIEGSYPEVKQLYIGAHMVNSPNYLNMYNNRDSNKYNFYFLEDYTIVTLKGVDILIEYQYNIDKLDSKPTKKSTTNPTTNVTKKTTKKVPI